MLRRNKPLTPLDSDAYHRAILEALMAGITTSERFGLFAETTADSLRLLNDLFSGDDPDDPDNLLYVDDFIYDLPTSRAPEEDMYVFLTYALHIAAARCRTVADEPARDWVPALQHRYYPTGRLHQPVLAQDVLDAYLLYGDDGLNRAQRAHRLNRQELQFVGVCLLYTMLATAATATDTPIETAIASLQHDLAHPGPTFTEILRLPQTTEPGR